ncbi:MAG: hypothetical protein R3F49_01830 [Planctomycetota bacterium]
MNFIRKNWFWLVMPASAVAVATYIALQFIGGDSDAAFLYPM